MRPIGEYQYHVKTEDGYEIGELVSAVPLHIGDTIAYKGNIGVITDGNAVSVYVKRLGAVIELKDAPKRNLRTFLCGR